MTGIIRVPVCAIEEVAKQSVIRPIIAVRNIRLTLLPWQKVMGQKAFVLQKQKI